MFRTVSQQSQKYVYQYEACMYVGEHLVIDSAG